MLNESQKLIIAAISFNLLLICAIGIRITQVGEALLHGRIQQLEATK